MKTLVLNVPDTLDLDDKEAIMTIATRLYEKGKLSLGQAAEMVGLSKSAFMEVLGTYGVGIFKYPPSDLDRDADNAKSYRSII
jgi:predicted HTH domain antitoxin